MVDILLLQTVSIAVASASVVAGVTYYALQIRHQTRTRDTDLVIRLFSTFARKEFQQEMWRELKDLQSGLSYSDLTEKYEVMAPETGVFFEGVGVLLHRKLIDISLVDDLFSGFIKRYWEAAKPLVEEVRKQLNYPQYGEWVEYLYNEMKKREQQAPKTS